MSDPLLSRLLPFLHTYFSRKGNPVLTSIKAKNRNKMIAEPYLTPGIYYNHPGVSRLIEKKNPLH